MSSQMPIAVLGSTGSIGSHTLELVDQFPDQFRVVSLTAGKNIVRLRQQMHRYRPSRVAVSERQSALALRQEYPGCKVEWGDEGVEACIHDGAQIVVMGIPGFAALKPTFSVIRSGKRLALASKEVLVVAGALFQRAIGDSDCECIPVDSEHSALFQLLEGVKIDRVKTLILTASGGPLFRRCDLSLEEVTPEIAVNHPKWRMGKKISVDSATLMNKALEVVEAHYLFRIPAQCIEIWIHPQSIVHGLVRLADNSYHAQWSYPNMKSSIGYALSHPERLGEVLPPLQFSEIQSLEFLPPDEVRFPAIRLVREALQASPRHLIALNAANEVAVEAFLKRQILFPKILEIVEKTLFAHKGGNIESLDEVFLCDEQARAFAYGIIT